MRHSRAIIGAFCALIFKFTVFYAFKSFVFFANYFILFFNLSLSVAPNEISHGDFR